MKLPRFEDVLVLGDGRRFFFTNAEHHRQRGFWFWAVAADGRSTLQGNLRLDYVGNREWRPL